MKQFATNFVFDYLFGNANDRKWYKFEPLINKLIRKDLKEIKKNSEVTNAINWSKNDWTLNRDEPVVIIKGKLETYWRVYFINKIFSNVVYLTPNGSCFIEDLNTSYNNINYIWQCDTFGSNSDYYMNIEKLDKKINHIKFIQDWMKNNTEKVYDENGKSIIRLKQDSK